MDAKFGILIRFNVLAASSRGFDGLVSISQNNVKSQKFPEAVSCRPIHACTKSTFEPLSRWIHNTLQPRQSRHKHLSFCTDEFLGKLRQQVFPRSCTSLHVDVDDFFMKGSESYPYFECLAGNPECPAIAHHFLDDNVHQTRKNLQKAREDMQVTQYMDQKPILSTSD